MTVPARSSATRSPDNLQTLPSIGPSLAQDLRDLGIRSAAQLGRRDPERLYTALNDLRGQRQDPCVLYSFRCAVYAARTARPKPALLKWWNWKGRTLAALALALSGITAGPERVPAQSLGSISFPNSGRAEAQAPFLRGVLLLHSFEYEDAAQAFRQAQSADPDFALAYWGEAMTFNHPLWNQQDLAAGRAALQRLAPTAEARRLKAKTEREQRFLAAVEQMYFAEATKPRRDSLYSLAMERISRAWPEDDEGQAFYALSLMGLSQGVRNVASYMRAGALAEEVYRRNPKHPGALHYIIHAFDDPLHAPLGLRAAREYSVIAADADHAQHMTTHIFLALGMWPETVRQNAIASGPDSSSWRPGHYTAWLVYGLLQQGKYSAAARHLATVRANLATQSNPARQGYMLSMRAHYLVNAEAWDGPEAAWVIDAPQAGIVSRAMDVYVTAVAQLARGQRASGRAQVVLDSLARGASDNSVPGILADQFRARLLWAAGRRDSALALLRAAAAREDVIPAEFGPPDIVKPTHELMGELLLAGGRPSEAQREFVRALELAPGRSLALLGLVRAANAAGDRLQADRAMAQLLVNWREADPGAAGLAELRRLSASD